MTDAQILIRLMTEADIAAVAKLCGDLDYPTDPDTLAARYAAVRAFPDNEIWVAECAGQVAGWVHGHGGHLLEASSYVEIGGIVVDPAYHRLGIGRLLLAACERWAYQRGYARIRLRSGMQRTGAHDFYRRIGYQQKNTSLTFALDLPRQHPQTAG
ncbi:GNAT family N-acetyltransferase [Chromobacterium sp. IIBBL 290-4]|uniref:GNAT family N-acetyltransferase n=1 Tax=Chromobacterium sp. IIBBL 290-4 TaxID=2953890 RepID=UPI0020B8E909|nr:GNAT family N-acetyltransferase [Chromobacterium sp. IIBBL 290-4]UTH75899.1 GNAT family N-acetyltransferase [Chromobacterium sp. IIBBL 290-4]